MNNVIPAVNNEGQSVADVAPATPEPVGMLIRVGDVDELQKSDSCEKAALNLLPDSTPSDSCGQQSFQQIVPFVCPSCIRVIHHRSTLMHC